MAKEFLKKSDFYKSRYCNNAYTLRRLDVKKDTTGDETITNASIFKGVAKMFLKGGRLAELFDEDEYISEIGEIEKLITDSYKGQTSNESEAAEEAGLKILAKGCRRYCRWEKSNGRRDSDDYQILFDQIIFVSKETHPELIKMIPELADMPIRVFFDVVLISKDTIEGICYNGNVASLSNAATSKNKPEDDPWMNIMIKALETLVPEDEVKGLRASYYYMKPKGVRRDQGDWEFISFENNSSIVTLEESFINTRDFKAEPTALDTIIEPVFKNLESGIDCDPEDCKLCFLNSSCNFLKTPEVMELKEVKKGKKVSPSDDQQKVIDWDEGILVVIAGAGAGKTECSAEHMCSLIKKEIAKYQETHKDASKTAAAKEVLPGFFMTTFTNAGVFEMKERMQGKLSRDEIFCDPEDLNIMTFNTFAYNIDKKFYKELGFSREPVVIDDIRNSKIIVNILNDNPVQGLNYESFNVSNKNCMGALPMLKMIFDIIKREQLDINAPDTEEKIKKALGSYTRFINDDMALSSIIDLYETYENELLAQGLILFSDQEPMALKMIDEHPEYLEELGYKHLVVDEFQDSNDIQMQFVKRLCLTSSYKSLVVVGDDFQAIYGFRNTSPDNMIHFSKKIDMPVTQHFLVDNYRSVPEVINLSNAFIKSNVNQVPKDLVAFRPSNNKPVVVRGFYDKDEEYDWILEKVQKILGEGKYLPEDICIIAGSNDELSKIGAKLSEAKIPIVMKNPQKFIENSRVRAAIALANAVWDPEATENYFQYLVAKYNGELVKEFTVDEILEMIENLRVEFKGFENLEFGFQRKKFHNFLEEIKGTDEIYQGFLDMLNVCEDFPSELDYIQDFKKYGRDAAKRMDAMYQGVVLVTAHSSKGLEWPVVINTVDTYDSDALHVKKTKWVSKLIEEKRRLLYVSMTRARDELYVIGKYNIREETASQGIIIPPVHNRFLREIYDIIDPNNYVPVDPNRDAKKEAKKALREAEKNERERRKILRRNQSILVQCKGDRKKAIEAEKTATKKEDENQVF